MIGTRVQPCCNTHSLGDQISPALQWDHFVAAWTLTVNSGAIVLPLASNLVPLLPVAGVVVSEVLFVLDTQGGLVHVEGDGVPPPIVMVVPALMEEW